ncbi:hypothetical protein Van01_48860 [Micromonospora andamanensis]|uniref:Sortase n=1 Tax=Micromonospora andamanensis TaxID=1287068 RepID=A0ABQ4I1B2_9ACTN|nr:hypothetical protein [Micromonospora andamanensis]GIJ11672.1 hypothetical protein Van01_48860 [Micromonospora andamanensis]
MSAATQTRQALSVAPLRTLVAVAPLLAIALATPLLTAAPAVAAPPPAGAESVASALTAVAPVVAGQPGGGQPAPPQGAPQPGPTVFVEVSPSIVEPGHLVGLRASCHDNSVGAIVVSDAFGRVAVQPQRGLLTGTAMVKDRVLPGNYRVKLECRGGETASTMIQVVRHMKPSRGPATGFGGSAGAVTSNLLLPGGLALTVTGMVLWVTATRRRGTRR